ncbi:hypothetical protein BJ170DRAFT_133359 [Xylariales sp. AK1849]|nr:hypothetical protein BJ170DRAFT_133359 [Xylariales sp. AK1849]
MSSLLSNLNAAQLELAWTAFIYLFILTQNTPGVLRNYQRRYAKSRFSIFSLYVHTGIGMLEVFRYYTLALSGPVVPSLLDLVFAYILSYGSFRLAKDLQRGHPIVTRPVYQSEALARIALSTWGYALSSAAAHRASVKSTDNFIYTRFSILFCMRSGLFSNSTAYAIGSFVSPLLAMAGTGLGGSWALIGFLTLLWWNIKLNRWTTGKVMASEGKSYRESWLVWGLVEAGFVEIEGLRLVKGMKGALGRDVDQRMEVGEKSDGSRSLDRISMGDAVIGK